MSEKIALANEETSTKRKRPSERSGGSGRSTDGIMAKKPAGSRVNAARAALEAMSQLEELTNRDAEGVVGVEKNEDGN